MTTDGSYKPIARNRVMLVVILLIIMGMACVPLVVRLLVKPVPVLNQTVRDLLPAEASKTGMTVLYGAHDDAWTPVVAALMPHLEEAAGRIFPTPTDSADPGGDALRAAANPDGSVSGAPVEVILINDTAQFDQMWVQIFGPGSVPESDVVRVAGRADFVLVCTDQIGTPTLGEDGRIDDATRQVLRAIAHQFGRAVLERHLFERLRSTPGWYDFVIGEMVAVATVPGIADDARLVYATARERAEPLTEGAFAAGFDGEELPAMQRAAVVLMAERLLESTRTPVLISLVRDGERLETAYRAAAGAAPRVMVDPDVPGDWSLIGGGRDEADEPMVVARLEQVLELIEYEHQVRVAEAAAAGGGG